MRAIRTVLGSVLATALLAGCGAGDEVQVVTVSTTEAAAASDTMPQDDGGHEHASPDAEHDHAHAEGHEVPDGMPAPTLAAEVAWSPLGGWDLHLAVTGFRFAPEHVSTEHIAGEGHAHVYVDGEKISRVYGSSFHLGHLLPSERVVRVELSANDHAPITVNGHPIEVTVTIDVAGDETPHGQLISPHLEADEPHPAVHVEIVDDPAGGWNLHLATEYFRIGSAADTEANGFVVLHIGDRTTRLYSHWHQVPANLPPGNLEIVVQLHDREGRPISVDNEPVADSTVLRIEGDCAECEPGSAEIVNRERSGQ